MQVSGNTHAADALEHHRREIVEKTTSAHFAADATLAERYGARGMKACEEDCNYHLDYLVQAVRTGKPQLFTSYVLWARTMLEAYRVPVGDLVAHLGFMRLAVEVLEHANAAVVRTVIDEAMTILEEEPAPPPSFLPDDAQTSALAGEYLSLLLKGRRADAATLVMRAVEDGLPVRKVYLEIFQPAQYEVGRLWQLNKISVAQEHYCTAATQLVMSQLYPHVFATPRNGRVLVAACVGGELHELGMRMVSDFFEMDGWDSFYMGANSPTGSIVHTLQQREAHLLALSTTISSNVGRLADIIRTVRTSGRRGNLPVIVGGYPFNIAPGLAEEIGADGWAADAADAVRLGNELVLERMNA